MTPPDPPPSPEVDEPQADDFPTVVALPVFLPEVPGARPFARAELEELLYEHTRQAVQAVADAAATLADNAGALDRAVAAARSAGASWADIGRATNMSRQAAQQRWTR